jgi:uncharacterized membrane protein
MCSNSSAKTVRLPLARRCEGFRQDPKTATIKVGSFGLRPLRTPSQKDAVAIIGSRHLKGFLPIAVAVGLGVLVTPLRSQDDSFVLRVCNASGVRDVYLATMTLLDRSGEWRLEGWYRIPDAGCRNLNRNGGPVFYYYAFGGGYHWGDNDSRQCINRRAVFDRIIGSKDYDCASTEILVGFAKRELSPGNETFELTLR